MSDKESTGKVTQKYLSLHMKKKKEKKEYLVGEKRQLENIAISCLMKEQYLKIY